MSDNTRIIYFAGSVSYGGGYRSVLFNRDVMSEDYTPMRPVSGGRLEVFYGGPHAFGCDHGCTHGPATHGASVGCTSIRDPHTVETDRPFLVNRCFRQIVESDGVFAYIDKLDCYGTLAEIGYASAMRKPIQIVIDETLRAQIEIMPEGDEPQDVSPECQRNELWFVLNLPGVCWSYSLTPDFDETVFSTPTRGERLVPEAYGKKELSENLRLRQTLLHVEQEAARMAERGSAMWRELLTAVIVRPIRKALDE